MTNAKLPKACPPLHSVRYIDGKCLVAGFIAIVPYIDVQSDNSPLLVYRLRLIREAVDPRCKALAYGHTSKLGQAPTLPEAIDLAMRKADMLKRERNIWARPKREVSDF